MTIDFEQLKVSKMTSLENYISPVMEKLETSNLGGDRSHSKDSIEYPASGVLTSLPHIHVISHRGYCCQIWAVKTTP